jgi:hypothetical protein
MRTTSATYCFFVAWSDICKKKEKASENILYCSSFHLKLECGGDIS